MCDVRSVDRYPERPCLPDVTLTFLLRDGDDVRRVVELRLESADVLVDQAVLDDVSIHLRQRRVAFSDSAQGNHELQEVGICLLPERFLRASEQIVEQTSDGVGYCVRVEVIVEGVVADACVQTDFDVVVTTMYGAQHAAQLPAEVPLYLEYQAAHFPLGIL